MDAKSLALRRHGALNPHPHRVIDPAFLRHPFFDPRDLVLVKYEMLRRVRVEPTSVTQATAAFGLSRAAFYSAQAAFEDRGLLGLLPHRPGPRQRHKMSPTVVAFLRRQRARHPRAGAADLAALVRDHFGIVVHPRTVARALTGGVKRGRRPTPRASRALPPIGARIGRGAMRTCAGWPSPSPLLCAAPDSASSSARGSPPGSTPGRRTTRRSPNLPGARRWTVRRRHCRRTCAVRSSVCWPT